MTFERTILRSVGSFLLAIAGVSAFVGNYTGAVIAGILGVIFYYIKDKQEE